MVPPLSLGGKNALSHGKNALSHGKRNAEPHKLASGKHGAQEDLEKTFMAWYPELVRKPWLKQKGLQQAILIQYKGLLELIGVCREVLYIWSQILDLEPALFTRSLNQNEVRMQ